MTRKLHTLALAAAVAAALLVLTAALLPGAARATIPGGSGGVAYVTGSGAEAQVCLMEIGVPGSSCLSAPGATEVALQPISGRWLVFVADVVGGTALYSVDTQAAPLVAQEIYTLGNGTLSGPTWISGSTLAFVRGGDIYTVDVGSNGKLVGNPVDRTNTPEIESDPTFLPNYRIGYVRDGDLWTMGTLGQGQTCVKASPGSRSCYTTPADESDLNFSLSGLYLASGGNVHRLKINKYSELTQAPVPVGATRSDERGPAPSPGGKELVFERAGSLVYMENATTTMDESPLTTGFAPDWGSVFKDIVFPGGGDEQKPYDVKVEMHGTFAVVDFKTVTPDDDDFAMVTLEDVDTGHVAAAFPDSSTTTWQDVVVLDLVPGSEYTLQIHGLGDLYTHSKTVTTLTRHVNVTIQNVHMLDDADGGLAGCGDFLFGFRTFAPDSSQDEDWFEQDMCTGDDWPSFMSVPLALGDVPDSFVFVQAFGVDDDCGIGGCPFISGGWENLDAYDSWGPWAAKTTTVDVSPDPSTPQVEELTRSFSMTAHGSSGEPDFTVTGIVEVSYS
jgi:hypothetical protein